MIDQGLDPPQTGAQHGRRGFREVVLSDDDTGLEAPLASPPRRTGLAAGAWGQPGPWTSRCISMSGNAWKTTSPITWRLSGQTRSMVSLAVCQLR